MLEGLILIEHEACFTDHSAKGLSQPVELPQDEVPKDEFRSPLIILPPIKADQLRQQIRETRLKNGAGYA